ncbi:exonuclease subunit SbcD [Marinospirillum sp. MEB164]|uniref:Nuclease SbcCD subunit D n=1 Tax=Marinospirillum alkalitolerans TaxID=3123374 RepID=A0ABW8PXG9_9GAMM
MKLLHTSDWHLGQHFFHRSRHAEQQAFLRWLLEVMETEQVDVLLVAGDIFDTATPPSAARELLNQFVVDVQRLGVQLILLGGNHDAIATLHEARPLLRYLETHVIATTDLPLDEQVITLHDRAGVPSALLCAVPYLRPKELITSRAGDSAEAKRQWLLEAMQAHYQCLYAHAEQRRAALGLDVPILGSGHLTALGMSRSDSERDLYIGTLEAVPSDIFPPFDYLALGHLHRPQRISGKAHWCYSGAPYRLSFDELSHQKQVNLVSFCPAEADFSSEPASHPESELENPSVTVTPLAVPVFQPMQRLRGDWAQIESHLQQLKTDYPQGNPSLWLAIELEDGLGLSDARQQIQQQLADTAVDVVVIRRVARQADTVLAQQAQETLSELTPEQVFEQRLLSSGLDDEADRARLRLLFRQALAEVEQGQVAE